ncbi:MAG: type I-MYXAN CRISPR-associated protein Cas6/Cmx6 [Gammaproteobacteria bacterium]|jgi:CRISPR-associated protein Cas6|nr:type I-MYXAN CRISPR-associated protein Cas6/Cmx6 [Gammaproteobacteria bacterium]MBT7307715.1 type I-MYXAN CRISPR-associated protein Cas6/Cmx6 [Gammaproteobacteria bacterium]
MSYWEENPRDQTVAISDEVVDLSFRIQCKALPVDHGWALSQAIQKLLPWLPQEPHAALHQILVAESGNGWHPPEEGDSLLYPSRRTRLTLRLPQHRLDEAIHALDQQSLHFNGHSLQLSRPETQRLSKLTTLYTRFALFNKGEDEDQFLSRIRQELASREIYPRKMVCGRKNQIKSASGSALTHSLMLADLTPREALSLQQKGLSEGKDFGCGLFLPHKTVENQLQEQE